MMSQRTNIQWCDSTCNPTMGCDGCELWCPQRKTCYAGTLHVRFAGTNPGYATKFDKVKLFPGRMADARWSDLSGKQRKAKPWLDDITSIIAPSPGIAEDRPATCLLSRKVEKNFEISQALLYNPIFRL